MAHFISCPDFMLSALWFRPRKLGPSSTYFSSSRGAKSRNNVPPARCLQQGPPEAPLVAASSAGGGFFSLAGSPLDDHTICVSFNLLISCATHNHSSVEWVDRLFPSSTALHSWINLYNAERVRHDRFCIMFRIQFYSAHTHPLKSTYRNAYTVHYPVSACRKENLPAVNHAPLLLRWEKDRHGSLSFQGSRKKSPRYQTTPLRIPSLKKECHASDTRERWSYVTSTADLRHAEVPTLDSETTFPLHLLTLRAITQWIAAKK